VGKRVSKLSYLVEEDPAQARELILAAMGKHNGRQGDAAKELDVDRVTLWRHVRKLWPEKGVA